jgi:septal ring factor EnvC (AmiA/AmiB activator)
MSRPFESALPAERDARIAELQNSNSETLIRKQDAVIAELGAEIGKRSGRIAELEKQRDERDARIAQLEAELVGLKKDSVDADLLESKLKKRIAELEKQLAERPGSPPPNETRRADKIIAGERLRTQFITAMLGVKNHECAALANHIEEMNQFIIDRL